MDSSERPLPDLAEDADQAGSGGMPATSRRQLLGLAGRAGAGGLVLAFGSAVVPLGDLFGSAGRANPALAQTTTSTAPGDDTVAAFLESIELALANWYTGLPTSGKVYTRSSLAMVTAFAAHHQDHAGAFSTAAGAKATHKANPKLTEILVGQLHAASGEKAVLQLAYTVENAATATHLAMLGSLQNAANQQLAASVLPVESQHAVDVGLALGTDPKTTTDYLPSFIIQDPAMLPDKFPPA